MITIKRGTETETKTHEMIHHFQPLGNLKTSSSRKLIYRLKQSNLGLIESRSMELEPALNI